MRMTDLEEAEQYFAESDQRFAKEAPPAAVEDREPMRFSEAVRRQPETDFGLKAAPEEGLATTVSRWAGQVNFPSQYLDRRRLSQARELSGDDGLEVINRMKPEAAAKILENDFYNVNPPRSYFDENWGKLPSSWSDDQKHLAIRSNFQTRTQLEASQEYHDRKPSFGTRAVIGASKSIPYWQGMAGGKALFMPLEASAKYAELRAPEMGLDDEGRPQQVAEGSGAIEAAIKAPISAVTQYAIERGGMGWATRGVGKGVGAALRAARPAANWATRGATEAAAKSVASLAGKAYKFIPAAVRETVGRLGTTAGAVREAIGMQGFGEEMGEELWQSLADAAGNLNNEYQKAGPQNLLPAVGEFAKNSLDTAASLALQQVVGYGASVPGNVRTRKTVGASLDQFRKMGYDIPDDAELKKMKFDDRIDLLNRTRDIRAMDVFGPDGFGHHEMGRDEILNMDPQERADMVRNMKGAWYQKQFQEMGMKPEDAAEVVEPLGRATTSDQAWEVQQGLDAVLVDRRTDERLKHYGVNPTGMRPKQKRAALEEVFAREMDGRLKGIVPDEEVAKMNPWDKIRAYAGTLQSSQRAESENGPVGTAEGAAVPGGPAEGDSWGAEAGHLTEPVVGRELNRREARDRRILEQLGGMRRGQATPDAGGGDGDDGTNENGTDDGGPGPGQPVPTAPRRTETTTPTPTPTEGTSPTSPLDVLRQMPPAGELHEMELGAGAAESLGNLEKQGLVTRQGRMVALTDEGRTARQAEIERLKSAGRSSDEDKGPETPPNSPVSGETIPAETETKAVSGEQKAPLTEQKGASIEQKAPSAETASVPTSESHYWRDGDKFSKVKGEAEAITVPGFEGHDLFVHEGASKGLPWRVTEGISGLPVGRGESRDAAVRDAETRLAEHGPEGLDRTIQESVANRGWPSPRHSMYNVPFHAGQKVTHEATGRKGVVVKRPGGKGGLRVTSNGRYEDIYGWAPVEARKGAVKNATAKAKPVTGTAIGQGKVEGVSPELQPEDTGQGASETGGTGAGELPEGAAELKEVAPPAIGKQPWEMTRDEHRLAENKPKVEAIQSAVARGKPVVLTTHLRSTRLSKPEHIRITSTGEAQIPEGKKWVYLTQDKLDDLAGQAGVKPVPFKNRTYHREEVAKALSEGKPVPDAVLSEYPELKPAPLVTPQPASVKAETPANPSVAATITAVVTATFGKRAKYHISRTLSELPEGVGKLVAQRAKSQSGATELVGVRIHAFYMGGRVYFIADAMEEGAREAGMTLESFVLAKAMHEYGVHFGLRQMMEKLYGKDSRKAMDELLRHIYFSVGRERILKALPATYAHGSILDLAEEYLARIGERLDSAELSDEDRGIWSRFLEIIKNAVAGLTVRFGDADVERIARYAVASAREHGQASTSSKADRGTAKPAKVVKAGPKMRDVGKRPERIVETSGALMDFRQRVRDKGIKPLSGKGFTTEDFGWKIPMQYFRRGARMTWDQWAQEAVEMGLLRSDYGPTDFSKLFEGQVKRVVTKDVEGELEDRARREVESATGKADAQTVNAVELDKGDFVAKGGEFLKVVRKNRDGAVTLRDGEEVTLDDFESTKAAMVIKADDPAHPMAEEEYRRQRKAEAKAKAEEPQKDLLGEAIEPEKAKPIPTSNQEDVFLGEPRSVPQKNHPGQEMMFSLEDRRFGAEIDRFLRGDIEDGSFVEMGRTPEVLRLLGADDLPMTIEEATLKKVTQRHALDPQILKQLPSRIADPVMVFASKTHPGRSLVVMTEIRNRDGKAIIAAIHLSKETGRNRVNDVASVYGKDREQTFIDWMNEGLLRYYDKAKSLEWFTTRRLQLPKVVQTTQGSLKGSILTKEDLVKGAGTETIPKSEAQEGDVRFSMEQTKTSAFKKWFGDWENDAENASKVVNDDGTPKVVYHGSPKEFTIFDRTAMGQHGTSEGKGFYFTDQIDRAQGYAGDSGFVVGAYLSIQNPMIVNQRRISNQDLRKIMSNLVSSNPDALSNYGDVDYEGKARVMSRAVASESESDSDLDIIGSLINGGIGSYEQVMKAVRDVTGYDGVIEPWNDGLVYVAFSPSQVKSAIGNRGTFDAGNPDIRFSMEQTKTSAFKKWFGDWENDAENASKVANEDGTPKVVYHGTGQNFASFDNAKAPDRMDKNRLGISWFSSSPEVASGFAGQQSGEHVADVVLGHSQVVPAYLDIRNPYIDQNGEFARSGGITQSDADELKAKGYDGIIWPESKADLPESADGYYRDRNGQVYGEDMPYPNQYAVFSPSQVKSATGNRGTFDQENPDIRLSMEAKDELKLAGKTAIPRGDTVSVPTRWLLNRLHGTVLHFGSGRAKADTEAMKKSTAVDSVTEYDPNYAPDENALGQKYDTVVSNYVLNVLPPQYRAEVLRVIANTLKPFESYSDPTRGYQTRRGIAYITVRGKGDVIRGVPEEDGVRTAKGTFQRTYTPDELVQELSPYFEYVSIIQGGPKSGHVTAMVQQGLHPPVAPDIRFSMDERIDTGLAAARNWAEEHVLERLGKEGTFGRAMRWHLHTGEKGAREDYSHLMTILGTTQRRMRKFWATRRVWDAKMDQRTERFRGQEQLFRDDLPLVTRFQKRNAMEYAARFAPYLLRRDMDAVGYSVRPDPTGRIGNWVLFRPNGDVAADLQDEAAGWEMAVRAEMEDLVQGRDWVRNERGDVVGKAIKPFSAEAAAAVGAYRRINHRVFDHLIQQAEVGERIYKEAGEAVPVTNFDGEEISIFEAMRRMGDRRGYFMPRLRKTGRYLLYATKQGENPRMEPFLTRGLRLVRASELSKQGYEVTKSRSTAPSEEAFLDASVVAMNDLMQNAIKQMEEMNKELTPKELATLGFQTGSYTRENKDGVKEKHFWIRDREGKLDDVWGELWKSFGGERYVDDQGPDGRVWHFIGEPEQIQRLMTRAAKQHLLRTNAAVKTFGLALASQISVTLHARGSRARKIGRNEAIGKDVWVGYETDPVKAMVAATSGIAGGTAKAEMARRMVNAMMGIEVPWRQYAEQNKGDDWDGLSKTERVARRIELYTTWEKEVEERRLDSGQQPLAYQDTMDFIREALRNEEPMERLFGVFKGLASLKFISGPRSAVVNLTTLAINVPAVFHQEGKIAFATTLRLEKEMGQKYAAWYIEQWTGKRSALLDDADRKLFTEIRLNGWDEPLMNTEAMEALQSEGDRRFRKIMDMGMILFSTTEQFNRAVTVSAGFRGLGGESAGDDAARADILRRAKDMSDLAHAAYGKHTLPGWFRGTGPVAQLARMAYMYQTFAHNQFHMMFEMGFSKDKRDVKALAWLLTALPVTGGLPTITGLGAVAAMKWTAGIVFRALGLEPPDDPEEGFYEWLAETFGWGAERFARGGVAGLAGVDISGSLAVGSGELPVSIRDFIADPEEAKKNLGLYIGELILGPMGSFVLEEAKGAAQIAAGVASLDTGKAMRGVEAVAPPVLAAPLQAFREYQEGVTTRRGSPVFYGDTQMRPSATAAIIRGLSFTPIEISAKRKEQWSENEIKRRYGQEKKTFYERVDRFAHSDHSDAEWAAILEEARAYNARVVAHGYRFIPQISGDSIKAHLRSELQAPKGERERESGKPMKPAKLPLRSEVIRAIRGMEEDEE